MVCIVFFLMFVKVLKHKQKVKDVIVTSEGNKLQLTKCLCCHLLWQQSHCTVAMTAPVIIHQASIAIRHQCKQNFSYTVKYITHFLTGLYVLLIVGLFGKLSQQVQVVKTTMTYHPILIWLNSKQLLTHKANS